MGAITVLICDVKRASNALNALLSITAVGKYIRENRAGQVMNNSIEGVCTSKLRSRLTVSVKSRDGSFCHNSSHPCSLYINRNIYTKL